jgi:hypothetical protein
MGLGVVLSFITKRNLGLVSAVTFLNVFIAFICAIRALIPFDLASTGSFKAFSSFSFIAGLVFFGSTFVSYFLG